MQIQKFNFRAGTHWQHSQKLTCLTKSKANKVVDFRLGSQFVTSLSQSTLSPKSNMFNLVDFVKSGRSLSPECRTSFRLCCHCVWDQSNTVHLVNFRQSRSCQIWLCRQCAPAFTSQKHHCRQCAPAFTSQKHHCRQCAPAFTSQKHHACYLQCRQCAPAFTSQKHHACYLQFAL